MKTAVIIVLLFSVLVVIAIALFSRGGVRVPSERSVEAQEPVLDTTPDSPVSFGYKNAWFVVRADTPAMVAESLGLKDLRPANWQSGLHVSDTQYLLDICVIIYLHIL